MLVPTYTYTHIHSLHFVLGNGYLLIDITIKQVMECSLNVRSVESTKAIAYTFPGLQEPLDPAQLFDEKHLRMETHHHQRQQHQQQVEAAEEEDYTNS